MQNTYKFMESVPLTHLQHLASYIAVIHCTLFSSQALLHDVFSYSYMGIMFALHHSYVLQSHCVYVRASS